VWSISDSIVAISGQRFEDKMLRHCNYHLRQKSRLYNLTVLQKVALDCLSYHATANDEDAIWLSKEIIPKVSLNHEANISPGGVTNVHVVLKGTQP
jgi:hypothetical protein